MTGCIGVGLDAVAERRLATALEHAASWLGALQLCSVPRWEDAWRGAHAETRMAVFDPFPPHGSAGGSAAFAAAHPHVWLVAYGRFPGGDPRALASLLHSGIHAFVTRDVDDTPRGFVYRLKHAGLLVLDRQPRARPR